MGAVGRESGHLSFYLDDDLNPLNANGRLLKQMTVPGNGAATVSYTTVSVPLDATNAVPGYHALYATISGGGQTRYLYAPELIEVIAGAQPPVLDLTQVDAGEFYIGVGGLSGQTIVLQTSGDLRDWTPLATNLLTASRWVYTNSPANPPPPQQYFRAVVAP